jgi:hypothetical protein
MLARSCKLAAYWLILVIFAAMAGAHGQEWKEIEDWEWELAPPVEYPDAAAIKIFDIGKTHISMWEGVTLERHVRIKVFDKDRAEDFISIEIPIFQEERIHHLEAHTITPDGERHEVENEFKKQVGSQEVTAFTFPAVVDGSILEYKYKYEHFRLWMLDPWYFQSDLYTLKSRYIVELAGGFTYSIACNNMPRDKQQPVAEDDGYFGEDYMIFTWELENLMPIEVEPKSSAILNSYAALYMQLSGFAGEKILADWSEYGELYQETFEDFMDDEDDIREKAFNIAETAETRKDTIAAIYEFVRDSIATDYKLGKYDRNSQQILEEKSASAYDKNMMLAALLQSLDYNAHPLLIATRDHAKFNPEMIQFLQFNHLVCHVSIDSSEYILDSRDRSTAFPYSPPDDLIYGGVLIDGEDSRAIGFQPRLRESGKKINTKIYLADDGSAVCSTCVCVRGHNIHEFEDYLEDSVKESQIVENLIDGMEMDYEIVEDSIYHDKSGDSLSIEFVLEIPELSDFLGDNMLVPIDAADVSDNPFKSERRMLPVDFKFPYNAECRLEVYPPENMKVTELPAHVDKSIDGLSFTRRAMYDGIKVIIKSELNVKRAYFQAPNYEDIKWVFDAMEESSYDQIALAPAEEKQ